MKTHQETATCSRRLTETQRALLFTSQLAESTAVYNVVCAYECSGSLEYRRLEKAAERVLAQYPALRSLVTLQDSDPYFRTLLQVDGCCTLHKCVDSAKHQFLQSLTTETMDLERFPAVRIHLIQSADGRDLLLVVIHHVYVERSSIELFIRDLAAAYCNVQAPIPPTFCLTQNNDPLGRFAENEAARNYWRERVASLKPGTTMFGAHRAATTVRSFAGSSLVEHLSSDLMVGLDRYCLRQGLGRATTLLSIYAFLLSQFSGEAQIGIAVPVSTRDPIRHARIIDPLINSIVIMGHGGGDQVSARDFIAAFGMQLDEGKKHSLYPFARMLLDASPNKNGERQDVAPFAFNYVRSRVSQLTFGDVQARQYVPTTEFSVFDFALDFLALESELYCSVVFDTDVYTADQARLFWCAYLTVLRELLNREDFSFDTVQYLPSSLLEHSGVRSSGKSLVRTVRKPLHKRIEDVAARHPTEIAVRSGAHSLSYGELNGKANQLARALIVYGATAGAVIPVVADRSPEFIVAVLGVIKAGCAYAPIDPCLPEERHAYILQDISSAIGVSIRDISVSRGRADITGIKVDLGCWEHSHHQNTDISARECSEDDLAYCIYTSGSTGSPKGVLVPHSAVNNLVDGWLEENPDLEGTFAAWASPAFDVSVFEYFVPLISGATLLFAGAKERDETNNYLRWLEIERVSTAFLPPYIVRELGGTASLFPQSHLTVLTGVEPIHEKRLYTASSDSRVAWRNGYGPTEATVYCTLYSNLVDRDRNIPIGRPIANVQIHVLDSSLRRVCPGTPGELYVAGAGLAKGYLNRPDLTAERFIPNPFGEPGSRMYRTGDIGRFLPDGNIEFLGRIDNQVKVRGFRIELGEIEAALTSCQGIREAVVTARQESDYDKRLVAYVVGEGVVAPDLSALRRRLQKVLPEYMLPSAFVVLDAMPLNANGKIDRRALPSPDYERTSSDVEFVAPRTTTEELLAQIWARVLKVEDVGVQDDFFTLGGHSLLATQVVARIRESMGFTITLREFLGSRTIARVSRLLARKDEQAEQSVIAKASRQGYLTTSFAQQRLWFLDQYEPGSALYNMPAAWRLQGQLDRDALEQSFNEVIRRHEVLRTVFLLEDAAPVQVITPDLQLNLYVSDLSEHPAALDSTIKQIEAEAARPFDLAHGPLIRAGLIKLATDDHVLFVTLHHVISDGWSIGILVRELNALYHAFSAGQPSPLSNLLIQYGDFAAWQKEGLQEDLLRRQLDYWKRQLVDAPPLLELPLDRPRPALLTHRGACVSFGFTAQQTQQLRQFAQQHQATLFITVAAAFNVLLYRHSRQVDICIGYPVANRNRTETERLIGFFVNTLVLRTRIDPDQSFSQLLRQVRETVLDADAYQDLPFEKLVAELRPERSLNHSPVFQVMLSLNNTEECSLRLDGINAQLLPIKNETAKFELTLSLAERNSCLQATFNYNTDLFDATTIERMAGHFSTLIQAVLADPSKAISELPMLTEAERRQVLVEWNRTEAEFPEGQCVHELFEECVRAAPEAIAVVVGGQTISYSQLNRKANRLAHHLRQLGVVPDVLVAVCMERSLEMIVALMAILKSGGAYVPMDPE